MTDGTRTEVIYREVNEYYRQRAQEGTCCDDCGCDSARLYPLEMMETLPDELTAFSLGCGNPVSAAQLRPGEVVLDLGSGGGLDCFLAAREVGPKGRVIGVDMTMEMIQKATSNARRMNLPNVAFKLGHIEALPLADKSVDAVISNCVINLSPDKPAVFGEILRVLRSGGRLAVADIVTNGPLLEKFAQDADSWAACVRGALSVDAYRGDLLRAGFKEISITPFDPDRSGPIPNGWPFSALIQARNPEA